MKKTLIFLQAAIILCTAFADYENYDGQNVSGGSFYDESRASSSWVGAIAIGTNFSSSYIDGTNLLNANFTDANLTSASLLGAVLTGVNFTDAIIKGASFSGTVSKGFTEDQLKSTKSYQEKDLSGIELAANDLSGWDFSGQNLSSASFYRATLNGANFANAVLKGAYMQNSDLTEASFAGANLWNADLRGATLTNVVGNPIYKNTIMTDGTIKNFSMTSSEDSLLIREHTGRYDDIVIPAKISEDNAAISGGAKLMLEQRAAFEITNGKTLTIASDGMVQIDTDLIGSTVFKVDGNSGFTFEDGATLAVNIIADSMTNDVYTIAVISFEDDSVISGLNGLVQDKTLLLTVNGEKYDGLWNYIVKSDGLYVSINVPEPAAFAAIFGLLALGFAARRNLKRK